MKSSEMVVFDNLKADVQLFVEPCKEIVVSNQDQSDDALSTAKKVKEFIKKVESTRVEMVSPLNEEVKRINAYAKQISAPLLEAETHIKKQLLSWELKLEAIRKEEAAKLEAARVAAEAEARQKLIEQQEEAATMAMFMDQKEIARNAIVAEAEASREIVDINKNAAIEMKTIASSKVAGVTRRWTFEVSDVSQVPREFLMVDEVAVRKAMNAGAREIPGIQIFQQAGISI